MSYTTIDLQDYAEKLELPVCAIEYLYDEYLDEEVTDELSFGFYIADRISDATYLYEVYAGSSVDEADERAADVFSEILELLGLSADDLI